MANRASFCFRFIHYAALLIFAFLLSHSFAHAAGGDFGGGGAGGSWEEPDSCPPQYRWTFGNFSNEDPVALCHQIAATGWIYHSTNVSSGYSYCVLEQFAGAGKQNFQIFKSANPAYNPNCNDICPAGYEKINGKCQPKKCPVGQSLVNGQCKPKTCPLGTMLDAAGNCLPPDDQCPAGQELVNGQCKPKTCPAGFAMQGTQCVKEPDCDPADSECSAGGFKLPPFCEWADVMCKWHEEWVQWSNDYNRNEEKANLDREELKRLSLDSKEYLFDLNNKTDTTIQKLEDLKIPLNQIKDQDSQFYDELRLWLENFDPADGTPSDQNPSISFPPFCDWSVQVCNWYLDWKDWRADYNAHNAAVLEKFNQNLERLNEIKQQDKEFYDDSRQFQNDVRDFFDWYKDQEDNPDPNDPNNPENEDGGVSVDQQQIPLDESQRITFVNGCPAGQQFNVSFMGQSSNLEFSYQPICQFMSMIRPFVIAIAYLIGAYILMGLSRGSSE